MKHIGALIMAFVSTLQWWNLRLTERFMPYRERPYRGHDRRVNPRSCANCGGPLQITTRNTDILQWFSCGRCRQSQVGIPASRN